MLKEDSVYPPASNYIDFVETIETLETNSAAKRIRRFYDEDIDIIKEDLEEKYEKVEKHIVTSRHGQHLLFLIKMLKFQFLSLWYIFVIKLRLTRVITGT